MDTAGRAVLLSLFLAVLSLRRATSMLRSHSFWKRSTAGFPSVGERQCLTANCGIFRRTLLRYIVLSSRVNTKLNLAADGDIPSSAIDSIDGGRILVQTMYQTLKSTYLCGATCVIVRSPPPAKLMFRFSDEETFKPIIRTDSAVTDGAGNSDKENGSNTENSRADKKGSRIAFIDCANSVDTFCVLSDDISTEELVFGRNKEQNNKSRLNKFLGGRVALRRAMKSIGKGDSPHILSNEEGAPLVPSDMIGSISHKDDIAVGVAMCNLVGKIGVDIERCHNKAAPALSRRLLTAKEQSNLGNIPGISAEEEVLLRFSFKESVFKAIHPFLLRPVGFTEVEVEPSADGSASITFLLKTGETFRYEAVWLRFNDLYWVTCVYFDNPVNGPPHLEDALR